MAKQKNNEKSDYMSDKMDEQLGQLEDKITVLYANASYEVNQEWTKFTDTFKEKDAEKQAQLEAGEITQAEYTLWRNKNILQTDMYKSTVSSMTDILTKSDITAMAMVNDEMPSVVAESYNFVQALGWKSADEAGMSVGTFQIYNADSVQKIVRDNPDLLKSVDVPEDKKWNKDHINREITTGIIKGESLPKVADRLARVTDMDKNSATRNARTAMTYAENLGRSESAEQLKEMGIPEEEVWSATYDDKVRDTHLLLDGTKRDEDGYFGAGILATPLRCPADPSGDPEEIYNCRCRLNIVLKGIDHSQDDDLYEKFMQENYPDDWKALQESESYQDKQEQKYDALQRKADLEADRRASEASETSTSEITSKDAQEATQGKSEASEGTEDKNVESTFVPAESVEEAQQRARDLGATYTKFDKWNLERANNALDALERLPSDCRPKAVLNGKDTSTITQRPIGRKSESWYGVTYDYRPFSLSTMQLGFDRTDYDGGQVVGINVQGYKTLDKLTEHKEKDNESYFEKTGNYWYFNTDGEATAHHEMGHCFYNERILGHDAISNEWEDLATQWANDSNYDMIKNSSEAFAEAWAGYQLNDERVPDYISDFIRRNT